MHETFIEFGHMHKNKNIFLYFLNNKYFVFFSHLIPLECNLRFVN